MNLKDENGKPSGLDLEILDMFCKMENINCSYKFYDTTHRAYFKNGTYVGMIRDIQNGSCDLSTPSFPFDEKIFNLVDFSLPITALPYYLITRNSEDRRSISVFSSFVFNWSAWLLLLIISALIGTVVAFCARTDSNRANLTNCVRDCLDVFSVISSQTNPHANTNRKSIRILLTFWAFAVLVICGIYSGQLISSLMRSMSKVPYNDFETLIDCIEIHKCKLIIIDKNTPIFHDITYGNDTLNQKMRQALMKNRLVEVDTMKQLWNKILSEKTTYLSTFLPIQLYLPETEYNKHCLYYSVIVRNERIGFAMPKNSTLAEPVNRFVANLIESAMFSKLFNKYFGTEAVCERNQLVNELRPINVENFFGCLFVLMIGTAVGTGVFVLEIVKIYLLKKKIQRL